MNPPSPTYRSLLFVPGHKTDWVEKGLASGADAIILDLEDSVPHDAKATARAAVAGSIARVRESGVDTPIFVRPNSLATHEAGSDIEAVAQPGLAGFFVPKVASPLDLIRYEALIDHFEHAAGASGFRIIVPVEMVGAIVACEQIAAASPRVAAMVGPTSRFADIARAVGYRWTPEGLESLYHRSRVLVACRAASVLPLTALWDDVHDLDGLRRFAEQGRQLGFAGQVVIHPSHVPVVNEVYGPDEAELEFYRGLVAAFEDAVDRGDAAVLYRGQHIDQAHADTARERLAQFESVGRA
jgi:citrate lyase subunit beta/citryl-CoA lyase